MTRKQTSLFTPCQGALFSDDRQYRYRLWREWDCSLPKRTMFIGLNPSTANETDDDPTIRRIVSFAKAWGCGSCEMMNLFSFITPYPHELELDDDWKKNRGLLRMVGDEVLEEGGIVLFAWGNFAEARARGAEIAALFPQAKCLGHNANGSPKHPLYIKGDTLPTPF